MLEFEPNTEAMPLRIAAQARIDERSELLGDG